MKQVYDPKGWNVKNPDLPILFLAGAEDPVIAGEKNWHKKPGLPETGWLQKYFRDLVSGTAS